MATPKQFKIAGLGEILWDIYGENKYLGGAPANFAAHVQQAGHKGIILSRVGEDKLGKALRNRLVDMQLESNYLQNDPIHPTGTVLVTLDQAGVPSFQCTKNVAFDYLDFNPKWQELASQIDAVLFGTLAQRNEKSQQTIQKFVNAATHAVKIFDINLRGWNEHTRDVVETSLYLADVIKLNEDELKTLCNLYGNSDESTFVPRLLEKFSLLLAAVTFGEKGAVIWTGDGRHFSPGFRVTAIDTTGSGDAFAAGLSVKLLENSSVEEMAEYANLLGAFVATQKGAVPKWSEADLENIRRNSERVNCDPQIIKSEDTFGVDSNFS